MSLVEIINFNLLAEGKLLILLYFHFLITLNVIKTPEITPVTQSVCDVLF